MITWTGYPAVAASANAVAFCPSPIEKSPMPTDNRQPLERSMTIRDAITAREELQDEINKLLGAFAFRTGLTVSAISLDRVCSLGSTDSYFSTLHISL